MMTKTITFKLNPEQQSLALDFARVCAEIVKTGGKQPPRFKNAEATILDALSGREVDFEAGSNLLDAIGGYVIACKTAVENHGENPAIFDRALEFMDLAKEIQTQMRFRWSTLKPGNA